MDFDLADAVAVLERTPAVLRAELDGLPDAWVRATDGPDTWSAFDVVGHLIHGERTDWIPRARIIREQGESRPFDRYDRFAQFEASKGLTLANLLDTFATLRRENLATLESWSLGPADLARTGMHPGLGRVTLAMLLATWVAHDLDHLVQIARTMARQYRKASGPWPQYLRVLRDS
jgi:DinB superfamily